MANYESKLFDCKRWDVAVNQGFVLNQVLRSRIEVLGSDKERLKGELAATKKSAKESRESLNNLQNQSEILTKQIMETNEEYRR